MPCKPSVLEKIARASRYWDSAVSGHFGDDASAFSTISTSHEDFLLTSTYLRLHANIVIRLGLLFPKKWPTFYSKFPTNEAHSSSCIMHTWKTYGTLQTTLRGCLSTAVSDFPAEFEFVLVRESIQAEANLWHSSSACQYCHLFLSLNNWLFSRFLLLRYEPIIF